MYCDYMAFSAKKQEVCQKKATDSPENFEKKQFGFA